MKNIAYREVIWRTLNDRLLFLKASYSKHVFHIRFLANVTANFAYDNSQLYIIYIYIYHYIYTIVLTGQHGGHLGFKDFNLSS